ncbi:MAG: hypothetical protein ABEJ36_04340 [Candidatus Nanosalina sp.]
MLTNERKRNHITSHVAETASEEIIEGILRMSAEDKTMPVKSEKLIALSEGKKWNRLREFQMLSSSTKSCRGRIPFFAHESSVLSQSYCESYQVSKGEPLSEDDFYQPVAILAVENHAKKL